jgi:hypothetical protein
MTHELSTPAATELTRTVTLSPEDRRDLRRARRRMDDARSHAEEIIRRAAANGSSLREIGEEVGFSHTWVRKIAAAPPASGDLAVAEDD